MTGPLGLFGVVAVVLFAGVTDALPPKKIVAASNAALGDFPYMVSLRYCGYHSCGGAIVGPRHIVTSARCFDLIEPNEYSLVEVATGSVTKNGGTNHAISKLIPYPDYDSTSGESGNEIGIVVLAEDIAFDKNQATLNLPTNLAPEGVHANLTGWGLSTNPRSEAYSTTLRKDDVKILRAGSCNDSYLGHRTIRSNQICSSGGDACATDNGNPLVYNGQLIGVGSYGGPCAAGYPDVYINVYHHVEWIKKTMKE